MTEKQAIKYIKISKKIYNFDYLILVKRSYIPDRVVAIQITYLIRRKKKKDNLI